MRTLLIALGLALASPLVQAATLCTIISDAATGTVLVEEGNGCDTPATPASTFKIPLALIGFDTGILADADTPVWPFKPGYADWGGAEWKKDVTPTSWMQHSVVWYSQQITERLGYQAFATAVNQLGYGNADVTGDPRKNNALERSWISSSLKISPRQQVDFIRRLLDDALPVSTHAIDATKEIVQSQTFNRGWTIWGKTGSAFPRRADGSFDRAHGWGWYVGWAQRDDTTLVFARLTQDDGGETGSAGLRTRQSLLQDWSRLLR